MKKTLLLFLLSTTMWVPDDVVYSYSSPYISYIGMNRGWGKNYYNESEWYTLTGDWIVDGRNYNCSREMIYNFRINND